MSSQTVLHAEFAMGHYRHRQLVIGKFILILLTTNAVFCLYSILLFFLEPVGAVIKPVNCSASSFYDNDHKCENVYDGYTVGNLDSGKSTTLCYNLHNNFFWQVRVWCQNYYLSTRCFLQIKVYTYTLETINH